MKKILLILLMSLLFTAFAALGTATITLNATVQGVHEIGIFDAEVAGTGKLATGITAVGIGGIGGIDPSRTSDIVTASKYLVVRTNQKAATTMTITIGPLEADDDVLAYNMLFDNDSTLGTGAGNYVVNEDKTHTITILGGNGVRVYNFPFHFTITPEQFRSAVPTDYTATVKFTYTAP